MGEIYIKIAGITAISEAKVPVSIGERFQTSRKFFGAETRPRRQYDSAATMTAIPKL